MLILEVDYSAESHCIFRLPPHIFLLLSIRGAWCLSSDMPGGISGMSSFFTSFWWIIMMHGGLLNERKKKNLLEFIMFGCILTCCPWGGKAGPGSQSPFGSGIGSGVGPCPVWPQPGSRAGQQAASGRPSTKHWAPPWGWGQALTNCVILTFFP